MDPINFSDKLFQRGQTWEECLGSWKFKRESFLAKVGRHPLLPTTAKRLSALARGARLAVYYSDGGLDSFKALPAIGTTLSRAEHLEARFFSMEIFFPFLREPLGRKSPLLLKIHENGSYEVIWGPRAEPFQQTLEAMADQRPSDREAWLLDFDDREFDRLTDLSIASQL